MPLLNVVLMIHDDVEMTHCFILLKTELIRRKFLIWKITWLKLIYYNYLRVITIY